MEKELDNQHTHGKHKLNNGESSSLTTESTANREGKPSIWAGFYKKTINERQDQVCGQEYFIWGRT